MVSALDRVENTKVANSLQKKWYRQLITHTNTKMNVLFGATTVAL